MWGRVLRLVADSWPRQLGLHVHVEYNMHVGTCTHGTYFGAGRPGRGRGSWMRALWARLGMGWAWSWRACDG